MVLTDREIRVALATGQITIKPPPTEDAYSSSSVDLRLGSKASRWKKPASGVDQSMVPSDANFRLLDIVKQYAEDIPSTEKGFLVEPGVFLLMWTDETVTLPRHARLAARVEGKSSMARLGIGVHVTAPTIHAGFSGAIQLEVFNHGPLSVWLKPGMKICQLIFEQTLGTPDLGYQGSFQNQSAEKK